MNKKDSMLEKAFKTMEQTSYPTKAQKEAMLSRILLECEAENASGIEKLKRLIGVYPWRFAFAASAVQAAAFTLLFGAQYTNLFLGLFGG